MSYEAVLSKVLNAIAQDELIDFTREVTRIPSVHGDELACGEHIAENQPQQYE